MAKKRIVVCTTCRIKYYLDHAGPLKSYENCPDEDCNGRHYRTLKKAKRRKM